MRLILSLLALAACAPAADLSRLQFLSGCWATTGSGPLRVEEHWSKPSGGNLIGYSRTFKSDRIAFFEFLRIDSKGEDVFYTPRLSNGQAEVSFRMIRSSESEVVFENPGHDFPQRILYRREGDQLNAAIEGRQNGKDRRENFGYSRVACP